MTRIVKEDGKTVIKTGERIDTLTAAQFETDIQPALEQGVNLEIDCSDLTYIASSGLRVLLVTIRTVLQNLGGQIKLTHVNNDIYDILKMTGFTRFMAVDRA